LGKGKDRAGQTWVTTHATYHLCRIHPHHVASEEVDKRKATTHPAKVDMMLGVQANSSANGGTQGLRPSSVPSFKRFALTKKQRQLTRQARWYIYTDMKVSKRQFDNNYFKEMLLSMSDKPSELAIYRKISWLSMSIPSLMLS